MEKPRYNAAIVPCQDYDAANVHAALVEALEAIGGLDWVKSGMTVGIKPNLASAKAPEYAVCTHPVMVAELARLLIEKGAKVIIGESPGGLYNASVMHHSYSATGMTLAEQAGATLNENFASSEGSFPEGKVLKSLHYTSWLDGVDALITFAKLKTHGMMGMTGAVKNLYGTIPGTVKLEYHYRFPNHQDFSDMLVDVYEFNHPCLALIDAVTAMDGNGPTAGRPRHCGALIAAKSAYDADIVGTKLLGVEPMDVPTLAAAHSRGLCVDSIEKLSIYGEPEGYIIPDCQLIPRHDITTVRNTHGVTRAFMKMVMASKPDAVKSECIGCGMCAKLCPAKAITMKNKLPEIDRKKCIRCFCCQEFCPKGAMKIKRTWIARLLNK
ncbi:MAG: DUF362 domain-containing protein [Eubacteriales bacterium]|nr:DUF362 domain-containing protein [Eubacteriales bacterium]